MHSLNQAVEQQYRPYLLRITAFTSSTQVLTLFSTNIKTKFVTRFDLSLFSTYKCKYTEKGLATHTLEISSKSSVHQSKRYYFKFIIMTIIIASLNKNEYSIKDKITIVQSNAYMNSECIWECTTKIKNTITRVQLLQICIEVLLAVCKTYTRKVNSACQILSPL